MFDEKADPIMPTLTRSMHPRFQALGFNLAARTIWIVGIAFVIEFFDSRSRSVIAANHLVSGEVKELLQRRRLLALPGCEKQFLLFGCAELQKSAAIALLRALLKSRNSRSCNPLRIRSFEFTHRCLTVISDRERAVRSIKLPGSISHACAGMEPQVQPLRGLIQGRCINFAQHDLDHAGNELELFRRKELWPVPLGTGMHIFGLAAGYRRMELLSAAERMHQVLTSGLIQSWRQLGGLLFARN